MASASGQAALSFGFSLPRMISKHDVNHALNNFSSCRPRWGPAPFLRKTPGDHALPCQRMFLGGCLSWRPHPSAAILSSSHMWLQLQQVLMAQTPLLPLGLRVDLRPFLLQLFWHLNRRLHHLKKSGYSIPMNIHGGGSCKPFYRHKMVFTIKWLDTAYKMSGPNPNENTIFWGDLTPEHLEITFKISIKWLVPFTNGQGASQQISAPHLESNHFAIPSFWFCHSFILLPMPPSANPGLSMGNFGIVWATCP